jgi:thiamine-phosphate pyrophosphorylase
LIVITPDTSLGNEPALVNELFKCGLNRLHLRKPAFDKDSYISYINNIDTAFHDRIVVCGHFELYNKLKLGGVHLNAHLRASPDVRDVLADIPGYAVSTSFHSWTEIIDNAFPYKYVFISPVFNSISKVGYNAAIDLNGVGEVKNTCIAARGYCSGIIGLGGVGSRELPLLQSAGFDGAAMLGAVWQAKDPVAEMTGLLDAAKAL